MSKQLTLSASLSVLAMLGMVLATSPAATDALGLGPAPLHALASASIPALPGELMPQLLPALQ